MQRLPEKMSIWWPRCTCITALLAGTCSSSSWRHSARFAPAAECCVCAELGSGLQPCLITYNTVLSACAKAGMYDKAMEMYQDMQQQQLIPDIFTLTSLINACDQVCWHL